MNNRVISDSQAKNILFLFCILHVVLWTGASTLFRGSVTHDTLEGIAWGYQWQWGYHKHPFMAAWLSAGVTKLFGGVVGWPVYLLSQLAVVVTFVANYKLAKKIMSTSAALISVLLLEGIIYHNINSINFTPDTAQTPFWSLTALFFYNALFTQRAKWWLLTAFTCALALVTKYSAAFLYLPMIIIFLFTNKGRKSFGNKWIYISLVLFLSLISPHLYWMYDQGFVSVSYIDSSFVNDPNKISNHIYYPAKFIASQLGIVAGLAILTWPFWGKLQDSYLDNDRLRKFDKAYVLIMGLTPMIATILYSVFTGKNLIARWSTPYFYLAGIVFMALFNPVINTKRFNKLIITGFAALFIICTIRIGYYNFWPHITNKARSDTYLPNQEIAKTVTNIWHNRYNSKLEYVAGDHYLTAFISAYSNDKPTPYMSFSKIESPWINEEQMRQKGGILAWRADKYTAKDIEKTIEDIKIKFPNVENLGIFKFKKKTSLATKPVKILVAVVPKINN